MDDLLREELSLYTRQWIILGLIRYAQTPQGSTSMQRATLITLVLVLLVVTVLAGWSWSERARALAQLAHLTTAQTHTLSELQTSQALQATAEAEVAALQRAASVEAAVRATMEATRPADAGTAPNAPCSDPHTAYGSVYRKGEPDQNAEISALPQPDLTPEAVANNEEAVGKVRIELILAPCGVTDYMVFRGHVPYGLTAQASKAAKQIMFNPAVKDGRSVPQYVTIDYEFYACDTASICAKATEVVE